MYARVLRKWSLTKVLMYLWLVPVIMLLAICCPNATSMHLNIINARKSIISTATPSTIHKYPAALPQLTSTIHEGDKETNQNRLYSPIDNVMQNDAQNNKLILQQYHQNQEILRPNIYGNTPIISNYNNDDDNLLPYQIFMKNQQIVKHQQPEIVAANHRNVVAVGGDGGPDVVSATASPILIAVKKTALNTDSIRKSDIDTVNASANVPNLNSQIINLNNFNNINNNNNNNDNNFSNKNNSFTSSANIDALSSINNLNTTNRKNKFRRHVLPQTITDNVLLSSPIQISSINQPNSYNAQAQPSIQYQSNNHHKDRLTATVDDHHQFQYTKDIIPVNLDRPATIRNDRLTVIGNNGNNQNIDMTIMDEHQQQERLYEQRERQARIEAHRRQIRLKQLPSPSTNQQIHNSNININNNHNNNNNNNNNNNKNNDNNYNSDIENNRLLTAIPIAALTHSADSTELNKELLLAGRNRRDSRAFPLHLSSVPSSQQSSSYSTGTVGGSASSSMTMLSVSSTSYPSQATHYRQYITSSNNNNNNNNNNYNNNYQQQPLQQRQYYNQHYHQLQQQQQHQNHHHPYNNNNNNNHQLQQLQQYQQLQQQQQQHHHHHHQQQQQHHNHNHNHNNNHHQSKQQRKRPRRYCSARDPAQLAFEAPTVFEGKITSMSADRRANFSVTFEVIKIFKKQVDNILPHLSRLQFTYRNGSSECDIYREKLRPRGLVHGNELAQGRIYILFVQQIDLGNFTILGQPVRKTRRVIESVMKAVSQEYAQAASIVSLTAIANNTRIDSDKRIKNGHELRIVCKVSGNPPPKVTWFKDQKSINRNRKLYQFVHSKKRSELIIGSFNSTDAGVYQCRAKNKISGTPHGKNITIEAFPRITHEGSSQQSGDECRNDMLVFCLNGGTCKYFKEINQFSCECPDGFFGIRCEEKQWNETANPTFKTGYMADDPTALESSDDDGLSDLDDESVEELRTITKNPIHRHKNMQ